jgi:hypothetical protein
MDDMANDDAMRLEHSELSCSDSIASSIQKKSGMDYRMKDAE